jgi:hypothetical protein
VGRQLGVRIRSHRPTKETEGRPDQLHGDEECRHPRCELGVPLGLRGLSLIAVLENKLPRTHSAMNGKRLNLLSSYPAMLQAGKSVFETR